MGCQLDTACSWLRSENPPCATFLCRRLCQFCLCASLCPHALCSDGLTWIKRPTPGGMLLSGQKERPLQLHYISLRVDVFLLTFFLFLPFSLSLCTNNTASQIDMFLFFLLWWPAGLTAFIAHRWQLDIELYLSLFHKSPGYTFFTYSTSVGSTVSGVIVADDLTGTVCLFLFSR